MTTLDLRGAAALMKVNPRTVEAMARAGRIPAAKIGRAYVLMERDVLNFIEQQIAGQTARRGGGFTQNVTTGENMTTEVAHSSKAEGNESALTPKHPDLAAAELPEHECGLPHVGQPRSAFHETEDELKSRLSAPRIAHSSARLLTGN